MHDRHCECGPAALSDQGAHRNRCSAVRHCQSSWEYAGSPTTLDKVRTDRRRSVDSHFSCHSPCLLPATSDQTSHLLSKDLSHRFGTNSRLIPGGRQRQSRVRDIPTAALVPRTQQIDQHCAQSSCYPAVLAQYDGTPLVGGGVSPCGVQAYWLPHSHTWGRVEFHCTGTRSLPPTPAAPLCSWG